MNKEHELKRRQVLLAGVLPGNGCNLSGHFDYCIRRGVNPGLNAYEKRARKLAELRKIEEEAEKSFRSLENFLNRLYYWELGGAL